MICNIEQQLERDEGRSLVVYPDQFGNPTIGIGHKLLPWEHYPEGISSDECDRMFTLDLISVQNAIRKQLPWVTGLDDARLGVIQNMCFNMGIWKLLGFKQMLAHLQDHDWQKTGNEMMNSLWAIQLPARARRLEQQMVSGEWQ